MSTIDATPSEGDSNKKPNAKHVSRACLECRHRHMKCGGQLPKCKRCAELDKDCSYVKSNRGGSRKKGVKKVKLNTDDSSAGTPTTGGSAALKLPCVDANGEVTNCPDGHTSKTCGFLESKDLGSLPCHSKTSIDIETREISASAIKFLDQSFDHGRIINNYFTHFHHSHPILPPANEIGKYLELSGHPKELLAVMKVIGDGYVSSKYSKNINEVFDIATEISGLINSIPKDVISLQTLILLSLVCHISALHDLSTSLRKQAIELAIHLDINNLDIDHFDGEDINGNYVKGRTNGASTSTPPGSATDELNINFYNTKRVRNLPDDTLQEGARRCFWELFFLDIIIGSSDGKTLSKLTSLECFVDFPSVPSKLNFDYETRSYTSKLVDDSVRLNNIIFSEKSIGHHYSKLTASLSNWELKFSNPDFYKLPYLIDGNGIVNEGIQQGLIMLNYAKIFTHRPLSFLWRSDIPQNLKCVELLNDQLNKNENCQDLPNEKDLINSRKIIETRKTIDAANLIAKTLIDTNPVDILKRTPLNACSLAFAGLVHLSAYLWSSQIVNKNDSKNSLSSGDLNIYEEYMKLEFSGIYQISAHWYLSSKIANYLMENISKLVPNLYSKMQSHFHHFTKPVKEQQLKAPKPTPTPAKPQQSTPSRPTEFPLRNDLSKILDAPAGFLDSGMSYNLPTSGIDGSNAPGSSNSSVHNAGNSLLDSEPLSPASETGCDWIDKNQLDFDFSNYNFGEFDFDSLTAIDEMIKSASANDMISQG